MFHPRLLSTGGRSLTGPRRQGLGRWAWELVRRTSAPARLVGGEVAADSSALLAEPFAIWAGEGEQPALSSAEVRRLRVFLDLGGVLLVDDAAPETGAFGRSARRELLRVIPEVPLVRLAGGGAPGGGVGPGERARDHVIYRSFYLVDKPVGRVLGPPHVEAIVRGQSAQVLLLSHDLLGALARAPEGEWSFPLSAEEREYACRFAVNLAMYVLCSNYKDDQVHAQALMRRRGSAPP